MTESERDIKITTYLALTSEQWGVCCEDLGEDWPNYNGSALYSHFITHLGFCSTKVDQIHNGTTLDVAYPILSIQCLLCPGDFRSQGISRHGIDPQSLNIPSPASKELTPEPMITKVYEAITIQPHYAVFTKSHQPIRHCWWVCKKSDDFEQIYILSDHLKNFLLTLKIEMSDDFFKMSNDLLEIVRHIVWWYEKKTFVNTALWCTYNPK